MPQHNEQSHAEKVRAGIAKAKARGGRIGRLPALSKKDVQDIRDSYRQGLAGRAELARRYGVGTTTIHRVLTSENGGTIGKQAKLF